MKNEYNYEKWIFVTGSIESSTVFDAMKSEIFNSFSNGTLKLTSVSAEDAGLYECIADNGIPPAIKSNFTIFIRGTYFVTYQKCFCAWSHA